MIVNIETEKTAVKSILDKYVESIENADMRLYEKNVAHDSTMVNFGAMGIPIIGWNALKQVIENQNAALSQTKINVSNLNIHIQENANLAWATCLWELKAIMVDKPITLPVRCTWVLEKRQSGWVIVHFHKSVAMS